MPSSKYIPPPEAELDLFERMDVNFGDEVRLRLVREIRRLRALQGKAEREMDRFKTLWDHTERERDELAAACVELQKSDNWEAMCGAKGIWVGPPMNFHDPKSILVAHDRELVKPLVEALTGIADFRGRCIYREFDESYRVGSRDAFEQMADIADAALAKHKLCICDNSGTVFDSPTAPCPECGGKERK